MVLGTIRKLAPIMIVAAFGAAGCVPAQTRTFPQIAGLPPAQMLSASAESDALPDAPKAAASANPSPQTGRTKGRSFIVDTPSSFAPFQRRERRFIVDLAGPTAFLAPLFESGIDTVRPLKVAYPSDGYLGVGKHPAHGNVPEWDQGAQGYAKRYADRFGQGLVSTASRYALGEALRQDVTYHRCECSGLFPRAGHAFLGAYVAHTRSGRALPSLPALAAPYMSSEFAVVAWYPGRYNASDALRISVLNYVAAPFKNLFSEFFTR